MSMLSEFKNHSDPIVSTPSMEEFIEQAPVVLGDLWDVMCDLRGVKPKQKREKGRKYGRQASLCVFKILTMDRVANRRSLKYWAMISNISGFSRGVGQMAESAYAYSGQALSNATQRRLWAKLTGSNKEGISRSKKDNADHSNLALH